MGILIINPNSTASMTDAMVKAARQAAPGLSFEGWTSHDGPPAIQGPTDGDAASGPLLELVAQANSERTDGIIIGCFDDTALADAARLAHCPVIGIGQASYHYAAMRGWRFSVVTTLAVSIPVIESNIQAAGLSGFLGGVRASEVPVLALEEDPNASKNSILAEAQRAEKEDDVHALVLGCAGMVHVTHALRKELDLVVLDPVETAATAMAWITANAG